MSSFSRLRGLLLPTSIGLIVVVAIAWYSLVWLPPQQRYLDERNFRVLSTLSEEIAASINNIDQMMDNAVESGISTDILPEYLKAVAPSLQTVGRTESQQAIGFSYSDPPRMAVAADEGSRFLYLAFKRDLTRPFVVRTDLVKQIHRLLPNYNPFDVLLVVESDGTVVFQKSSPEIQIAQVKTLDDVRKETKDSQSTPTTVASLLQSSRIEEEVRLAGASYRMYSQPVQITFMPAAHGKRGSDDTGNDTLPTPWVLCGLVRVDHFHSESRTISYTYTLWFSGAIVLVFTSYPFLRVRLTSQRERLRPRDVFFVAIATYTAAAILTFILIDSYFWRTAFQQSANEEMKELANAIANNFASERKAASDELDTLYASKEVRTALPFAIAGMRPRFAAHQTKCRPTAACRENVLSERSSTIAKLFAQYPYVQFATWSDTRGDQRLKWTIRSSVTPFINLDSPSVPYYSDVKAELNDPRVSDPTAAKVGSLYSPTTGENVTVFWKLMDYPIHTKQSKILASLVTFPISTVNAILPGEFQFAIIRQDGVVVYHSDRTRNLRENFFAETDHDQEFRSLVVMRSAGTINGKYMGMRHRLYVQPMKDEPSWSVVVFRNSRIEETANLQILSLATILFLLYTTILTVAILPLELTWKRGTTRRSWLWPDSRKSRTYLQLAILNILVASLLGIVCQVSGVLASLICTIAIPVGALVLNAVSLMRVGNVRPAADVAREVWCRRHAWACVTLLLLVAVLPSISFFKVAWDFEHRRLIEHGQLLLANNLSDRTQRVRSQYQGVDLGTYKEKLLSGQIYEDTLFFSHENNIRKTTVDSTLTCRPEDIRSSLSTVVNALLNSIRMDYNELAVDERYLVRSTMWTQCSTAWEDGEEVALTIPAIQGNVGTTISSFWTPLTLPWKKWHWWLSIIAPVAALFWLVRWSLRTIFLLDLPEPATASLPTSPPDPESLLTELSENLFLIGSAYSEVIRDLTTRKSVQVWDVQEILNMSARKAKVVHGEAVTLTTDPVNHVVRDGRSLVIRNLERIVDDPERSQQCRLVLEKVLSLFDKRVVITSRIDPQLEAPVEERVKWQRFFQSFVPIDLNATPLQAANQTLKETERQISMAAYYHRLWVSCTKAQKLCLVQLAQENLANPNSRRVLLQLIEKGMVKRPNGILAISDDRLAAFLEDILPSDTIRRWERQGGGIHSATLHTSLLVAAVGVAAFVYYTQAEVFNTWVTWVTGLAATLPAVLRMMDLLRPGGAQPHSHEVNS